jgi:acetoacetyl-CoA synthetase
MADAPLWQPSRDRVRSAHVTALRHEVNSRWHVGLGDTAALWRFSVDHPERFWPSLWDYCGIVAADRGARVIADRDHLPGARFFPDARLNFAENLLRGDAAREAIVFRGEDRVRRRMTLGELRTEVARCARALTASGVGVGDRVAACLPNLPEAVVGMLATASVGGVWSSCSPDFGVAGVLDRFGQIAPKVLICADGYFYGGKVHDVMPKVREIAVALPSVKRTVVVPYADGEPDLGKLRHAARYDEWLAPHDAGTLTFAHLPFNQPLYVLYSSGTTGAPKCLVHGAGGTLLQHVKEHQLHCDVRRGDRVFYYTTCGWMMWNWLASALASEATLLLYDGAPMYPGSGALFDFADEERMTLFGTSARYLASLEKAGVQPALTHGLEGLRTITSTGSPLAPESFDFVYGHVKADVHLASISGGTDIIGCFVSGDPTGPVWRGEIQMRGFGMRVEVFDATGASVRQRKGELVCTNAFPSMPLGFWNDPEDRKYRAAYFERYPGAWHHGDYAEVTAHDGFVIHGRSDAVLNPGGVRIGTAEIYRQVEQSEEVVESLVVGQQHAGDERIVLFVRLREGCVLDAPLVARIKERIRTNATPRHVPAVIVQVADIPRTRSGKVVELAVRDVINGRPVSNREALANPEALDLFAELPELRT